MINLELHEHNVYHVLTQILLVVALLTSFLSIVMNTLLRRFIALFDIAKSNTEQAGNRISALETRVTNLESALSELATSFQQPKQEESLAEVEQLLSERGV